MTLQVRVGVPPGLTDRVVAAAAASDGTSDIALHRGASLRPAGDVVIIHSARESAGELLKALEDLQVPQVGSITLIEPRLVLSDAAEEAKRRVPGDSADAVIWDQVTNETGEEAKLSWTFLVFIIIATQLAGIGIVTNSTIAIVGAMVVGPEFGPLAALSLALVERRFDLARRALMTLVVGFTAAMAVTAAAAAASIPLGWCPEVCWNMVSPRPTSFIIPDHTHSSLPSWPEQWA
ncbi:hypothetical protein AHiyo6_14550 [Arthrobacter sp. Hiyo6]|nr:hypothetical protein AHiyo6_14550 [Arthrobacter sp. Hiyo6]